MTMRSTSIDLERLRADRLSRLQEAMRNLDVETCLLCHDPNVRYATGASAMPVWSMSTFARCALVPQQGIPVLFEHAGSVHRSRLVAADVRPMHAWEFFDDQAAEAATWAKEISAAVRELGGAGEVAVDRLGTPAFLALADEGVRVRDASPVTQAARERKTPDEVEVLRANGRIVVDMLTAFEDAVAPGISERDLVAVLADVLLRSGGEYLATNTVCSGPNTNPWRAEATGRRLQDGDLVFVDTDCVALEGYFSCVSRTFRCGEGGATTEQRETYGAARRWLEATRSSLRPGISMADLAAAAPAIPDRYRPQRYECTVHGIGLEEESPSACDPRDPQPNPGRVIEPGMAFVVECYFGEVGAHHGVKLGDQVLVTDDGIDAVAPYPLSDLLG